MNKPSIRFCPLCGTPVVLQEVLNELRPVCPSCGYVHYDDPKVAVAVIVLQEGKVLLTRRIYPPEEGCWTVPAGFMNAFEEPVGAAERECLEETGLQVRVTGLLDVLGGREHPRGADVLLAYLAEVVGGELKAGDDASAAAFFPLDALPPLAFASTKKLLAKLKR